jgi:pimeloyl-ACP methyl ester carboxylesterase
MYKIESFLSARLFIYPESVGEKIFFISNLSGHLSLYSMEKSGSVPQPLLPPQIALQNPHLIGNSFKVFPKLGKILVMIDNDGDEDYKPMLIPIEGGYPEPAFDSFYADHHFFLLKSDPDENLIYLHAASNKEAMNYALRVNLTTGEIAKLHASAYGAHVAAVNADHSKIALLEGYTVGDHVLSLWEKGEIRPLYGTPLEERQPGTAYPLTGLGYGYFVNEESGLLISSTLFEDTGDLCYIALDNPNQAQPVKIGDTVHKGVGELENFQHIKGNRFLLGYNIDGADWVYEGRFDFAAMRIKLEKVLLGHSHISNGVLEHLSYEKATQSYALSYSTATSPTQVYTIDGNSYATIQHTQERTLGIPETLLSPGEDASFTSFDGLRASARLYLPNETLGFEAPYPLVYYVHGGPQAQERPDFAWFSMPLIQFLTLNGFAVFVPNVRGSTGYGLEYTKKVDRDWGGDDRLDHVHAMTKVLPNDPRLDTKRAAVVGRSYGGYMTLTLAARHPELWAASCDMFGPYDLLTFGERIPETWKPYFKIALGDPDIPEERALLVERSPRTYIENLGAPMLVIQGKNDPRVVEQESRDLVEHLRSIGKEIEYLMFENEGHDVLKFENRVTYYNTITDFFKKHL